jgi:phage gp16-like protein
MASNAIKAVHACRRQVAGLEDDDAWRDFLHGVTGKRHLTKMDGREHGRVIDELQRRGAKKKGGARAGRRAQADGAVARKIRALWLSLWNLGALSDPSEDALAAFVKRQAKVDDLRFLSASSADVVIEALKKWCEREGFDQPTREDVANITRWRNGTKFGPGDFGIAAKVNLIRAQWRALENAGAFNTGAMARLQTFLQKNAGVMAPHFLTPAKADQVIERLGNWLRRARDQESGIGDQESGIRDQEGES